MNSFDYQYNPGPYEFSVQQLGSLNPEALKLPVLRHKSLTATYDHISELAVEIERLQYENHQLELRLQELSQKNPNSENENEEETTNETNPFSQFKQHEIQFSKKSRQHEIELNNFAKHLNDYREYRDPTFVEIKAETNQSKKTPKQITDSSQILLSNDSVFSTLLVSNQHRSFFSKVELDQQNEELKKLIKQQEENLRLIHARLNLFHKHDRDNSLTITIDSLRKGEFPSLVSDSTPSKASELAVKKRVLSNELQKLVKIRKELVQKRKQEKENNSKLSKSMKVSPQKPVGKDVKSQTTPSPRFKRIAKSSKK